MNLLYEPNRIAFAPFYDGACPLCQAEILYLQTRNQQQLVQFVDVNSSAFDPDRVGVSCQAALAQMVGQIDGQTPIHGVLCICRGLSAC